MKRRTVALAAIVAAVWMTTNGRAADTPIQSAALAWDRGDYVTALLAPPGDRVWVGTRSNGLNRCSTAPFSCERFDGRQPGVPDLGHHHVTALRTDGAGDLWVATSGGGLRRAKFGEGS